MADKIKAYGILLYKIEDNKIKILLCKSVKSLNKWGCLKGMQLKDETPKECAKREFLEESSITIETFLFEEYFCQNNKEKDIGIWIVEARKVDDLDEYFFKDKLYDSFLSWENSKVRFFDLEELPEIKEKQVTLVNQIKDFLQNKHQFH